jgi:hypothetical protein
MPPCRRRSVSSRVCFALRRFGNNRWPSHGDIASVARASRMGNAGSEGTAFVTSGGNSIGVESPLSVAARDLRDTVPVELVPLLDALANADLDTLEAIWESILTAAIDES